MDIEKNIYNIGLRVKKTFISVYKEDKENVGEHIVITRNEFNDIKQLINDKNYNIEKLEQEIKNVNSRCNREIENLENIVDKKNYIIEDKENHIKSLKKIAVKRSNAERNIENKKKHHGYIQLSESEKIINKRKKRVWCLQTPYPVELNLKYVKENAINDLNEIGLFSIEITDNNCLFFYNENKKFWCVNIS